MCSKTRENETVIIACHSDDYICVDQNYCTENTVNARDMEHVLVLESGGWAGVRLGGQLYG